MKQAVSHSDLRLCLVSALPESGGGYLHRLFDGHPELKVYPFEMQLGTEQRCGDLNGYCFKPQYRWPRFQAAARRFNKLKLHDAILDCEVKNYLQNRCTSKFAKFQLDISYDQWHLDFCRKLSEKKRAKRAKHAKHAKRTVPSSVIIETYLNSFFANWRNRAKGVHEKAIFGHCPTLFFDMDAILNDFPNAKLVCLIRHPIPTFYDSKRRLSGLSVQEFCRIWNLSACISFYFGRKYSKSFMVIHFEDLISKREKSLKSICRFLGISFSKKVLTPSWNGRMLSGIHPFGGVPEISLNYDRRIFHEMTEQAKRMINSLTAPARQLYGYLS